MSNQLKPKAIYHAFDEYYDKITEQRLSDIANTGYSHIQIAPAQKSNPSKQWWARYQPFNYSKIEGRGPYEELSSLINRSHDKGLKVIADVVFNHMANLDGGNQFEDLSKFPGLSPEDFNTLINSESERSGTIDYNDGDNYSELWYWLGDSLPDLKHTNRVLKIQTGHLKILMDIGIDGFRFDAAKHMPFWVIQHYIDYINAYSAQRDSSLFPTCWNYLEVITDNDTPHDYYNWIASITDFNLYHSMKSAFSYGGSLKSLKFPLCNRDARSATFGRNHDNIKELNDFAIAPYSDKTDSFLATAYVLAKSYGTPLIMNWDDHDCSFIRAGVSFRQEITKRMHANKNVKENILDVIDSDNILFMERGNEGFCIINKAAETFDIPVLDLTLTNLEGSFFEVRNNFEVKIQKSSNKKYITQWGGSSRGGIKIHGREALYFIKK
jgi:alpha-amylase